VHLAGRARLPDRARDVVAARWEALKIGTRKGAVKIIMPDLTLMPGAGATMRRYSNGSPHSGPGETGPEDAGSDWQGGSLKLPGIGARHAGASGYSVTGRRLERGTARATP
jgi:hypothetical protein